MNNALLAYCRPGYENDTANELTALATDMQCFGYPEVQKDEGVVRFIFFAPGHAEDVVKSVAVSDTIFIRQMFVVTGALDEVPREDRVGPILKLLSQLHDNGDEYYGDVRVEYPDTESGKTVAKFCRKFVVPLRQALRGKGLLTAKEQVARPALHILFTSFEHIVVGESYQGTRSELPLGICRLKFPPHAPSRSTLKLEEAIVTMMTAAEREQVFREGGRAVDLGACPGGWTYQLVHRGLFVEAIDNGSIADSLMATGQVEHFAADGFSYRPQFGRVDLLVCDMIEQPDRVARLMGDWLKQHLATHAIFNLKLPMKKRYETVRSNLHDLTGRLRASGDTFTLRVRHLYHDRDEVTVTVIRQEN